MAERLLQGVPASPGTAAGRAHVLDAGVPEEATVADERRPAELAAARAALAAAGAELDALAARLRAAGREAEAEIVETGQLMAADPALDAALESAVTEDGLAAPAALAAACGFHAGAIAALGDPVLAARADDVRSLGRRAARLVGADGAAERAGDADATDLVLVAHDLGPADVAELPPGVVAIALAAGAPSAHAAVVARGLGIPMAVALGDELLLAAAGELVVVDGAAGVAALSPAPARLEAAGAALAARRRAEADAEAAAALPTVTRDGRPVRVLVNAATPAEAAAGLRAGADGIGLLRTELAFLDAPDWPGEAAHRRALEPVLAGLAGRVATVRVLDFGADKTPPFLRGTALRGLALLLAHPAALEAQLRAIVAAAAATDLRILLPLVGSADDVRAARAVLERAAGAEPLPALGAMVETGAAVADAAAIARAADFISIGTNDLTADVLGDDRFSAGDARPHDPRVLDAIAATTAAARAAGRIVEVCGEAASDALMLPLLVGLGVGELSVGAARVGETRAAVRGLDAATAEQLAGAALEAPDAPAVEQLVRFVRDGAALLGQAGDAVRERREGERRVLSVGPEA
jgi:phosphoenolpyruvate-protein kinase (PTS system EI component)